MKKPILKNHCLTVKIRLKKKYSLLKQLSNLTKTRLKISVKKSWRLLALESIIWRV